MLFEAKTDLVVKILLVLYVGWNGSEFYGIISKRAQGHLAHDKMKCGDSAKTPLEVFVS